MMTSNTESKREQMQIVSMDALVPQDHIADYFGLITPVLIFAQHYCFLI